MFALQNPSKAQKEVPVLSLNTHKHAYGSMCLCMNIMFSFCVHCSDLFHFVMAHTHKHTQACYFLCEDFSKTFLLLTFRGQLILLAAYDCLGSGLGL